MENGSEFVDAEFEQGDARNRGIVVTFGEEIEKTSCEATFGSDHRVAEVTQAIQRVFHGCRAQHRASYQGNGETSRSGLDGVGSELSKRD